MRFIAPIYYHMADTNSKFIKKGNLELAPEYRTLLDHHTIFFSDK